jgi:hypothetical protein
MKLWKEGDRSRGVCEHCRRLVETRFDRRTVTLKRPRVSAPDVLVAVCTQCGNIVAIPYQSTPRLHEARRKAPVRFEARIPKELDDALGLVADKFSARLHGLDAALARYYLHVVGRDRRTAVRIKALAHSILAQGKGNGRLSLRLEADTWDRAWTMARQVGMKTKSELIRGVMVAAAIDADVATADGEKPSPAFRKALEAIAVSTLTS